jgi:hypothetical protein
VSPRRFTATTSPVSSRISATASGSRDEIAIVPGASPPPGWPGPTGSTTSDPPFAAARGRSSISTARGSYRSTGAL